jgi:hypothetical protein
LVFGQQAVMIFGPVLRVDREVDGMKCLIGRDTILAQIKLGIYFAKYYL